MHYNVSSKAKMKLGNLIKYRRNLLCYSQEDLGFLLGLSQKSISNIENGKFLPSIENAALIELILGIDCLDFIMAHGPDPLLRLYFHIKNIYKSFLSSQWHKASYHFNKFHSLFIENMDYILPIHKKICFIIKSFDEILNFSINDSWHSLTSAKEIEIKNSKINLLLNEELKRLRLIIKPLYKNSNTDRISSSTIKYLIKLNNELKFSPKTINHTERILKAAYIKGPYEKISCKKLWQGCLPCKDLIIGLNFN